MESLAGRVILLWGWQRALVGAAAGALAALAQPPFDFFAACFVAFPVLVWLADGAEGAPDARWPRRLLPAFAVGWWFGFGYFVAGLWWIGRALLVDAEAFAWALPLAVIGLPAVLAVFYGLATLVARLMWSDGIGRIAALAFGFGLAEWLRAVVLTGFPWNAIGQAAMPVEPLMQSVAVTGLFGMNALAVFVFAMPALLGSGRHAHAGLALATLLAALHAGYGLVRLELAPAPERTLAMRVVQPSIDQTRKWDTDARDAIFATYLDLSFPPDAAPVPLIVWPETAVPFLFTDRPDALAALGERLGEGQMLLAGAVRRELGAGAAPTRYYNAVVAVDDAGEIAGAVDKVHLVPFGEYLPLSGLLGRLGLEEIAETVGPFSAGGPRRTIAVGDGANALPLICYEIIFPSLVLAQAAGADLMVNVTNDAWYGRTPGPYQHFRQARLRAVEAGLPLVRAANNGISALVDGYGRVIDALDLDAYGTLEGALPVGRVRTLTLGPPARNGAAILALLALVALVGSMRGRPRAN